MKQWLQAGYVEAEVLNPTVSGTAQGAVISPMLLNVALDGMERLLDQYPKVKEYTVHSKGRTWTKRVKSRKYGFARYADDLLVTAETREDIEAIKPILEEWLSIRGLNFHEEKTHIVPIEQGVNFLGFVRPEVAYTAVMTQRGGHNLVCCHQYPTQTCGWSNPAV